MINLKIKKIKFKEQSNKHKGKNIEEVQNKKKGKQIAIDYQEDRSIT